MSSAERARPAPGATRRTCPGVRFAPRAQGASAARTTPPARSGRSERSRSLFPSDDALIFFARRRAPNAKRETPSTPSTPSTRSPVANTSLVFNTYETTSATVVELLQATKGASCSAFSRRRLRRTEELPTTTTNTTDARMTESCARMTGRRTDGVIGIWKAQKVNNKEGALHSEEETCHSRGRRHGRPRAERGGGGGRPRV